jgi:hypothetical protein
VVVNYGNFKNSENFNSDKRRNMTKNERTYKITGCAMKKQHTLGPGFEEGMWQRSLGVEMEGGCKSLACEEP